MNQEQISAHNSNLEKMNQALQLETAGQPHPNQLEESQAQSRKITNPALHTEVRPVHVLDLADELLARIFESIREREVQDLSRYKSPKGVDDIMSVRLTCRRFCDTSSHLLLCRVEVELRCSSLSRFESISRHPIVSKGVQAVRVYLGYYDEILATDFRSFVDHQYIRLFEKTNSEEQWASIIKSDATRAIIRGKAPSFHKMLASWRLWLDGHIPVEALAQIKPLRAAFFRYKKLYVEQQNLCENDRFVQRVAAGLARMARATRFEMHEHCVASKLPKSWAEEIDDDGVFVTDNTQVPLWLGIVRPQQLYSSPAQVFRRLPSAIQQACSSQIHDLNVEISQPSILSALVGSEEEVVALKTAMQGLKSFSFLPLITKMVGPWPTLDPGEVDAFGVCLSSILSTPCLHKLILHFGSLRVGGRPGALPSFSFGSLTRNLTWENLQYIHLCNIPIYLSELERLFAPLSKPIDYLNFQHFRLLSGTWAEALEILHNKDILSFNLFGPSGGELDDLTWEEREFIFAPNIKNRDMKSKAEQYVRSPGWEALQNPITTVLERRNLNVDLNSDGIEAIDSDE